MKISRKFTITVFLILFLAPFNCFCQKSETIDTTNRNLINAAREIMVDAGTCALITLDKEGRPRVRTMDPFLPENDLTVWLALTQKAEKQLK